MIKLFFLIIFFLACPYVLKADEVSGDDQEFIKELKNVKDPFQDGIPKPVIIQPPVVQEAPKPVIVVPPAPKPVPVVPEEILLPALDLQGVIVGGDVHQAIINDQVVPLRGFIEGAQVDSVSKEGVGLFFKGKKFFLKVD